MRPRKVPARPFCFRTTFLRGKIFRNFFTILRIRSGIKVKKNYSLKNWFEASGSRSTTKQFAFHGGMFRIMTKKVWGTAAERIPKLDPWPSFFEDPTLSLKWRLAQPGKEESMTRRFFQIWNRFLIPGTRASSLWRKICSLTVQSVFLSCSLSATGDGWHGKQLLT